MEKYKELYNDMCAIKNRDDMYGFLKKNFTGSHICELGVAGSGNLESMLLSCNPKLCVGVDIFHWHENIKYNGGWSPQNYQEMRDIADEIIKDYKNVIYCDCLTSEASKRFLDNFFDFIYIDADHSYEGCSEDLKLWWPKLKVGGIMSGHDYSDGQVGGPYIFGVKSAVDEFRELNEIKYFHVTSEGHMSSWFIIKTE